MHTRELEDRRAAAAYSVPEAARYLRLPITTLRSWVAGRAYETKGGPRYAQPIVRLAQQVPPMLSFINLCEAHLLAAIRHEHDVSFQTLRRAVDYLRKHFKSEHPLLERPMETDGKDLFIRHMGKLITISQHGQTALREVFEAYLKRIERDDRGSAVRLYPFTRRELHDAPRLIVIDSTVAFGKPVIVGSNISTSVIAERFEAGESIRELVEDYGRTPAEIEEAIRCELELKAA